MHRHVWEKKRMLKQYIIWNEIKTHLSSTVIHKSAKYKKWLKILVVHKIWRRHWRRVIEHFNESVFLMKRLTQKIKWLTRPSNLELCGWLEYFKYFNVLEECFKSLTFWIFSSWSIWVFLLWYLIHTLWLMITAMMVTI